MFLCVRLKSSVYEANSCLSVQIIMVEAFFVQETNWKVETRTAATIAPALFIFLKTVNLVFSHSVGSLVDGAVYNVNLILFKT